MALTPALDLREVSNDPLAYAAASVEAEQALLGACLYDNATVEHIDESLQPQHFFEPFHQRLWAEILRLTRAGTLADPITIGERFSRDQGLEELGGVRYLADLIDRAPPGLNAPAYGQTVLSMAVRREVVAICQAGIAEASAPDSEMSARELVEAVEQRLFTLGEHKASAGFQSFDHYLTGAVEMAAAAYSRDGSLSGLSTGLMDLDAKLGGLHPSDLIIIAARPSMGKSALAANIAFDVARHYVYEPQPDGSRKTVRGGIVAFFSLEMAGEQLAMRLLSESSGVSSDRLRKGDVRADEFGRVRDAALEIQEAPLHIDDTGGISIAKLCARARRLKRTVGLDLIVVDYLQLVTPSNTRRDANRVEVLGEVTAALKALAKELSVPVVALAQLSRQVENREDKKPQLADLRESGSIEQDADVVMFIYREVYYLSRLEPKEGTEEHFKWQENMDQLRGVADLIIGKQRHGPIGNVKVSYNEDLTKFGNLAREARFTPGSGDLPLAYKPGVDD